ncbi:unnamed protein product [Rotaria magnacalcarata]|uniref:EGF-like domain-containing protein n=2 Tax=Rotaria magnacalcarata TaxID=392030 RepID=A0A816ZBJ9_9BILA|nr:unnamed protein product [Rotaria magnacalcarata]
MWGYIRGMTGVVLMSSFIQAHILLYNTESSQSLERFDCVYYLKNGEMIPYCRQLGETYSRFNNYADHCFNQGKLVSFQELLERDISPSDILKWSSTIEIVDQYASFYHESNSNSSITSNIFVCNCSQRGTFGMMCEYELPFDSITFDESLRAKFDIRTHYYTITPTHIPSYTQEYSDILCYTTLECYTGALCLDWRDICNGEQQCMEGWDEENCDILEFNECEDDEYRCLNGMCIREEYWLDSDRDCMDHSDERTLGFRNDECSLEPARIECDDNFCMKGLFSCGDGQCATNGDRHIYQRTHVRTQGCESWREYSYMCELSAQYNLWTKPNGLCVSGSYNDLTYDKNGSNHSDNYEKCKYLIRCALSNGIEKHCPCNETNCSTVLINSSCMNTGKPYYYPYPSPIRNNVLIVIDENVYDWKNPKIILLLFGSVRCRGYLLESRNPLLLGTYEFTLKVENILCTVGNFQNASQKNYTSNHKFSATCWNTSRTFSNQTYAFYDACPEAGHCFSQYRIDDKHTDCTYGQDEKRMLPQEEELCAPLRKHRFRCLAQHLTCMSIRDISLEQASCLNKCDTIMDERTLDIFKLDRRKNELDHRVKSTAYDATEYALMWTCRLNFNHYCDSFWDLKMGLDEQENVCQAWSCLPKQYRCKTGQCIDLSWVCDSEWDCSDASDEEGLLLNDNWSNHNSQLVGLEERKLLCMSLYSEKPSFTGICDTKKEYPCYRASVSDPLDIATNRPCINLTQIGDGIIDCYGALDEKNTIRGCNDDMLGFSFKVEETSCFEYVQVCDSKYQLNQIHPDPVMCLNIHNQSRCSENNDVVCRNGTCVKSGRCDNKKDCYPHGEDEYWCYRRFQISTGSYYRDLKRANRKNNMDPFNILSYPFASMKTRKTNHSLARKWNVTEQVSVLYAYTCNRGMSVITSLRNESSTILSCLCPPAYYGNRCQYFSDRITVVVHLESITLPPVYANDTILVLVTFRFLDVQNTVLDHQIFYVNPVLEQMYYIKHRFYLLYSRSTKYLDHKRQRYWNRTNIIEQHPYSVHFVLYSLVTGNESVPVELGLFHYPIYFDFLPAFRLTAILKFPFWYGNSSLDPCANAFCPLNSICKPIMNHDSPSFYCSCESGFTGKNCTQFKDECISYCAMGSICKSGHRGLTQLVDHPLCICSYGRFGPRCNLRNSACHSNPCGFNGTCHLTHDRTGKTPFKCSCTKAFFGEYCEHEKIAVRIEIRGQEIAQVQASIIQFYDFIFPRMDLSIQHQKVARGLPSIVRYDHDRTVVPEMGILKIYDKTWNVQYFVLYVQTNASTINLVTTPKHCPFTAISIPPMGKPFIR